MKTRAGKKAAVVTRATNAVPGGNTAGAVAIDVTPEEREQLAQALAYFCVACGREHMTGEMRGCDVARAEAQIIAAIRRCP